MILVILQKAPTFITHRIYRVDARIGALAATAAQGALADSATQPGDLATVATSGSYNDLANLPTLFSGAYADLTGKPTLGTAAATASTDYATAAQGATADSALILKLCLWQISKQLLLLLLPSPTSSPASPLSDNQWQFQLPRQN